MDLIITLLLVYVAYRGYRWYSRLQEGIAPGPPPGRTIDVTPPPPAAEDDDYIDYEEVK